MSSFNGENLFAGGPCTFAVGPRGQQWARKVDLGLAEAGLQFLGDHAFTVEVRGRLTAADTGPLDALTAALEAQIGVKADLADDAGHTWHSMTLVDVAYDGPPERGRVLSVGYRALFALN